MQSKEQLEKYKEYRQKYCVHNFIKFVEGDTILEWTCIFCGKEKDEEGPECDTN